MIMTRMIPIIPLTCWKASWAETTTTTTKTTNPKRPNPPKGAVLRSFLQRTTSNRSVQPSSNHHAPLVRESSLRFLKREPSLRLLPKDKESNNNRALLGTQESFRLYTTKTEESSCSSFSESCASMNGSVASSSVQDLNWGNLSMSSLATTDMMMTMSMASFAASASSLVGPQVDETKVTKFLQQVADRIASHQERVTMYNNHQQRCLAVAAARYEAGSPNAASLVTMRRVQRLRDALSRVTCMLQQLQLIHDTVKIKLEEAQTMDDGCGGVDVDLEAFREQARQVEQQGNEPTPSTAIDTDKLLLELQGMVKERQRLKQKQQQRQQQQQQQAKQQEAAKQEHKEKEKQKLFRRPSLLRRLSMSSTASGTGTNDF